MADTHHPAGRPVPAGHRDARRRCRSTRSRCARTGRSSTALNYIKDQLDGTLSFRWSCRMGICGSCGMIVNGEPKLTCAHVPHRLRARPGPRRAAAPTSRSIRDLVVDIGDFMRKLPTRQAVDHPRGREAGRRRRVPADARASWTSTSSSACASTACSATRPARSTASTRTSSARRRSRWPQRYNLDSRDQGARERLDVLIDARGRLGLHLRRRVHAASAPRTSTRPAPSSATSSTAALQTAEGVPAAAGGAMSAHPAYTAYHPRWLPAAGVHLVVAATAAPTSLFVLRELSSIFVAWFVVYLLLLVRAVGRGRGGLPATSSTGPARRGSSRSTSSRFAFVVLHAVTWFNLTPQAMVVRVRGRRVPAAADRRRRPTPAGSSCRRSWPGWCCVT